MSTGSNTVQHRGSAADGFMKGAARVLSRWWMTYIEWRLQISELQSMSDRALEDMGISPMHIEFAARGEAARDAMSSRLY